jgi:ribosome-binding factor A
MASRRQIQVSESIAHMAGEFLARELGGNALVTVTHAELSDDFKNVTVFLSVLPQTAEAGALKDAKRARSDFRQFVLDHSFLQHVPTIDFEIDYGEKNRQRIDDLTRH